MEQTGEMHRRYAIAVIALSAALSGCEQNERQAPRLANQAQADDDSDTFSNTVEEAMCGTPSERAHAIGGIASDPQFSSQSDDVYDLASDFAAKGCPKPKD